MGLFGDETAQREMDKDAEIADLRRQLAAKSSQSKSKVVLKNEDSEDEDEVQTIKQVSIKLPAFNESNPELWFSRA